MKSWFRFSPLLLSAAAVAATCLTAITASAQAPAATEQKKFNFDCESWTDGAPPKEVFVVEGQFNVAAKEGNKVLQLEVGELVYANALLGDSADGSARIEARVFGSRAGRSVPLFGIGVHGQSGYRLVAYGARKELQLCKGDEVIKAVPLAWKSDAWYHMKLEVTKVEEKKWTISASAWVAGEPEPKEAMLTHEDATLKGQGKCSIWGTTFSNTPILFDDMKVEVSVKPKAP